MSPLREANIKVLEELYDTLYEIKDLEPKIDHYTSARHLCTMIEEARGNIEMPDDKLSRWVGYIQGVMAARGYLNVNAERDRTRPIYNEAYRIIRDD